jgi:hypothetical protein
MRDRIARVAAAITLAAGFALAWRSQLWLIVVAVAVLVLTPMMEEQIEERALARRTATCALHAPESNDTGAPERLLAADLAATANADTTALRDAIARVEATVADPWLRSLAIERLEVAERLVADSELPSPAVLTSVLSRRSAAMTLATATVVLMAAAVATRSASLFIPVTIGVAALVIAFRHVRQRDALPQHLAEEASTEPSPQGSAISEPDVAGAVRAVGGRRIRIVDRAAAIVARTDDPRRDRALARLRRARHVDARARVGALTRSGLAWASAAAAMVAASELVL